MTTTPPPGWEGLLQPDERILSQGRPEPGILWRDLLSPLTLMGSFFLALSAAWFFGVSVMLGNMLDRPMLCPFRVVFPLIGGFFWLVDTTPGTVWFAQELIRYTTRSERHGGVRRQQIHRKSAGFCNIAVARHVFAQMAPHRAAVTG